MAEASWRHPSRRHLTPEQERVYLAVKTHGVLRTEDNLHVRTTTIKRLEVLKLVTVEWELRKSIHNGAQIRCFTARPVETPEETAERDAKQARELDAYEEREGAPEPEFGDEAGELGQEARVVAPETRTLADASDLPELPEGAPPPEPRHLTLREKLLRGGDDQ